MHAAAARRQPRPPPRRRRPLSGGPSGFPDPQAELAMGKAWLAADVEAWIKEYRPALDDDDKP